MFKTRLLSGIVLVIIAFATIFLGGDVLFATLLIISLIGVSELYKVVKIEKAPLGIVGYIGVVAYYFSDPCTEKRRSDDVCNHFADPCNGSLCICLSEICV